MKKNFEDYVRGVYYLENQYGQAKASSLADRLEVSKNTATLMVQRLSEKGLMVHPPYGAVTLTPKGRKMAKKLTYRHRLIEYFLSEKLGVSQDKVHEQACALEHAFSDEAISGLEKLLDHPESCPHGKPLKA